MGTDTVIERYYNDYIDSDFLTESELSELKMLLNIITGKDDINTYDIITSIRAKKGLAPTLILPLDLNEGTGTCAGINPSSSPSLSYLDQLRTRELKGDQRTKEWKMRRHDYITASVSAACAGLMGPASRQNQLLEKASLGAYSPFKGGYYTDIGNIFEPATNSYYSYINHTRIHDYGLIPNNKEPWTFLAASTDGVAARGTELTNIEIKTLPGRVPDGKVKKVYYHQMQHQMECLGLSHSDFIEVKYEELPKLPGPHITRPIGVIAELYGPEGFEYEYSPAGATNIELQEWIKSRDVIIKSYQNLVFVRWIYWVQTHYSCIRVERDPKWIVTMGPLLKEFYEEMTTLRKDQRRVNQMIRDRETKVSQRRNVMFNDCLI